MKAIERNQVYNSENGRVVDYLDGLALSTGIVHPDVEERMKKIADDLDCAALRKYENSTIVIREDTNTIVAVAFGTAYSLRAGSMFDSAISGGARMIHDWSDGSSLDLNDFGGDWIVGAWHRDESMWIDSI